MKVLTDPSLQSLSGIGHAYFTREGGVSSGYFASLNCALETNDLIANARENRKRAMSFIGRPVSSLVTVKNKHGNEVVIVDHPWEENAQPEADGMVTNKPGITLGALSADCPLILFADNKTQVIGIAHSGWRGSKLNIANSVVQKMLQLGAKINQITVCIGPSIMQKSYELGPECIADFLADDINNSQFFIPSVNEDHALFDIRAYIKNSLQQLGLTNISEIAIDTYTNEELFFSYRRRTHRKEPDNGCQLACIYLSD